MKLKKAVTMLSLALLLSIYLVAGSQDEAYGRVVKVVDGDTIDVQLQDSLISEYLIRVRLADIDTPETRGPKACEAGKVASAYTRTWLLSNYVLLDLDDKTGKDPYGRPCSNRGLQEQRVRSMELVEKRCSYTKIDSLRFSSAHIATPQKPPPTSYSSNEP